MREGWRGFRNGCALNDIWLIGAWRCMASHNKRLFFHYSLIELRFCFSFGRACFRRLRRFDRWGVGSLGEIEYGVGLYEWTRHLNMNGRLRLKGIQMVHICWIPPQSVALSSSAEAPWRLLLSASPSDVVGELPVASIVRGEGVTVQPLWAATAAFRFGRVLADISSLTERLDTRLMEWNRMQRAR